MDQHLEQWLNKAYFYAIDQPEDALALPEAEKQFAVVGEYLFDLPPEAGFAAVLQRLGEYYALPAEEERSLSSLCELLLVFTVSHDCEVRAECVALILAMHADAQQTLMQIIQTHLSLQMQESENSDENEQDNENNDEITENDSQTERETESESAMERESESETDREREKDREREREHVPHTHTRCEAVAPSLPAAECSQCAEHTHKIDRLSAELQRLRDEHQSELTRMKQQLANEQHRSLDGEVVLMEKDKLLYNLQHSLQRKSEELAECEASLQQLGEYKLQVQTLLDELDVLRPKAAKHDALESTMQKLREKLEELSEVKAQLKDEAAAHSLTYHKLVEIEKEVEELRKLPPQIESYRGELAELNITAEELKQRLSEKERELQYLRETSSSQESDQQARLNEHRQLVEQLRVASEELRERERSGGIGEGLCELNPALMQELQRLRSDNESLLGKLDKSSLESLDKLSRELADQKAMNASLQSKWMTTKDQLQTALREIDSLSAQLQLLRSQHATLQRESDETRKLFAEERETQRVYFAERLHHRERQRDCAVALALRGRGEVEKQVREALSHTQEDLQKVSETASSLSDSLSRCKEELAHSRDEAHDLQNKRKQEEIDHMESCKRMKLEHGAEIEKLQAQEQQRLLEQQQVFSQKLQSEAHRIMNLTSDLEAEVNKRRKVERLKKMFETDAQRLKVQLQAVGGEGGGLCSGGDYEVAVKELKTMQEQLDSAHQEIVRLKNQLSARPTVSMRENEMDGQSPARSDQNSSMAGGRPLTRAVRLLGPAVGPKSSQGVASHNSSQMMNYIEQSELNDKRVEQLTREKRELLSRFLEENKEKTELAQKLTALDKENALVKAELRKMTLDKARIERKYLKIIEADPAANGKENLAEALL